MDTNIEPTHEAPGARPTKLGLLSAGFVTMCILFLAMFSFFQPDQLSLSDRYFPSPTATLTGTPTSTPTLTPTRTPRPTPTNTLPPSLTPTAYLLLQPLEGVTVVKDTFESNTLGWSPFFSNTTLRIENGKLLMQSKETGYIGLVTCRDCLDDDQWLYLQAELLPEKDVSTEYGLAFCASQLNSAYYVFFIDANSSSYALYKHKGDNWEPLIINAPSKEIHKFPASNTLAVNFDDGHIDLYINGSHAETYNDADPLVCRWSGVIIGDGKVNLSVDNVYAYNLNPGTVTPTP
jgi:hypothetical protein